MGNQVIDDVQILGFPEFQRDSPRSEIGKLKDHNGEENSVFEDQDVHLPFLKSSMVQEATLVTEASETSSSGLAPPSVDNNGSKVLDDSFMSVAFQSSSLQPIAFAEEMALQVEESQDKVDSDPELPLNMVESEHTASSDHVNNALTTIDEHVEEKIELGAISTDVLFGDSVREGLYMFYEDNNSVTGSMTPLSSLKSLSPHTSFMTRKGLQSATGNTTLNGSGLSKDVSLHSSGNYVKENAL